MATVGTFLESNFCNSKRSILHPTRYTKSQYFRWRPVFACEVVVLLELSQFFNADTTLPMKWRCLLMHDFNQIPTWVIEIIMKESVEIVLLYIGWSQIKIVIWKQERVVFLELFLAKVLNVIRCFCSTVDFEQIDMSKIVTFWYLTPYFPPSINELNFWSLNNLMRLFSENRSKVVKMMEMLLYTKQIFFNTNENKF